MYRIPRFMYPCEDWPGENDTCHDLSCGRKQECNKGSSDPSEWACTESGNCGPQEWSSDKMRCTVAI